MTDRELQIEAMMHLEYAGDFAWQVQSHCSEPWVIEMAKRINAAEYLIQAMGGGFRPENFQEIVDKAREYDAAAEAHEVIRDAQGGRLAL